MKRTRCAILGLGLTLGAGGAQGALPERISLDGEAWRVHESLAGRWDSARHRFLRKPRSNPRGWLPDAGRTSSWFRASVPGAVLADLVVAGAIAEPFVGLQSRAAEWVSQRDWIYNRGFDVPAGWRGSRLRLRFEGIDPGGVVFLNGAELGTHRGMFTRFELEVTHAIRYGERNELDLVVFHAPDHQPRLQSENEQLPWQARFATGWDFAPRLVPVGLWDSVVLLRSGSCAISSANARAHLVGTLGRVEYQASVSCVEPGSTLEGVLRRGGREVARARKPLTGTASIERDVLTLERPELWYPNGMGAQPLYELELTVRDGRGQVSDRDSRRVGFRTIDWSRAPLADANELPYHAAVNGVPIFLKGWNWVPADQLYGRVDRARYERLLGFARASNANVVRVWGGGLVEKEAFYDVADEMGLLIWQESPLTSAGGRENLPGSSASYLAALRTELSAVVGRRRHHTALAVWGGGNELVDEDRRPIGSEHPYVRATREVVASHAPDLLVLPTSPSGAVYLAAAADRGRMGDVHGPWRFLGPERHAAFYDAIDPRLHSEFGIASLGNESTLREIAPESELWPPGSAVWDHHNGTWFDRPELEALFGPIEGLGDAIRYSQFVQAEGLRYAVEAHRRRYPRTVGSLVWQLNEPWPAAAGTYAVDYRGEPKPAYWWVRRAFEPISLAAAYPKLVWRPGEEFAADLWYVREGPRPSELALWYRLEEQDGRVIAESKVAAPEPHPGVPAVVATIRATLPQGAARVVLLRAELRDGAGRPVAEHRSVHVVETGGTLRPLRTLAPTRLEWAWLGDGRLEVRNVGAALALGVQVEGVGGAIADNYRFLAPSERWSLSVEPSVRESVRVVWWNR